MSNDPHRGRGGRYMIDDDGNRIPVKSQEAPLEPVKQPAPVTAQPKQTKRSKP